jgi:hypothetical protein
MKKLLLCLAYGLNLVACTSVSLSDTQQDQQVKSFQAPAHQAGIYIYRHEILASTVKMAVSLDGQTIGHTAAKTFLYKEVAPGKHTLTSVSENTSTLDLHVKAGKLYYVWQEVKMGIHSERSKLHLVSETLGQRSVLETQMAQTR